ncbi:conserved Plasmodium protein, unknown function [Plasmodium malariae]|uniref:Uncharacterized protein n=1 Tax=Plasmodium malariae TaxID=5858 RepID=A0A1D3JLT2_PLAMA|nr:conserved Plasmodium protein, unknown function [Plasmodium malariae]SBT87508.1 conserved Plasmodium protein, unknown function [Plasmodium malariae]
MANEEYNRKISWDEDGFIGINEDNLSSIRHNNSVNEKSSLLITNECKDSFLIDDFSRRPKNMMSVYYENDDEDNIFGGGENSSLNKNLKTLNLSDIKKKGVKSDSNNLNYGSNNSNGRSSSNNNTRSITNGGSSSSPFQGLMSNVNDALNFVPNSSTITSNKLEDPANTDCSSSNNYNSNNNSNVYHHNSFFEKEYSNTNNVGENKNNYENYEHSLSGKMNIINLSENINVDNKDSNNNNSFDLFPFFKSLNSIRTKLLSYYDLDNDVVIYRCMCALLPYFNVYKTYDFMNNFIDIEKNEHEMDDKNRDNANINETENDDYDDENENITKINNMNNNFNNYNNKLSIEKNPDIYAFVWLNIFISFVIFFLFNIKNMFFSNSIYVDSTSTGTTSNGGAIYDDTQDSDVIINMKNYMKENKLNILYNSLLFIYSFNIFIPVLVHVTNYFVTKKVYPIKLSFLISLMSYNNIILLPVIFIYKYLIIETTSTFFFWFFTLLRFILFVFYMTTSIFYIYKYVNKMLRIHFESNIVYLNYAIFLFSYMSFYLILKSYILNYL